MIKVLFVVLILSTAAIIAVGLAIHFRVRRHLDNAQPEAEMTKATKTPGQDEQTAHIAGTSEEANYGESGGRDK